METISLKLLLAHWLAFFVALQQFFWNYTPQPLLSVILPKLIEDGSKVSQSVRIRNPSDYVDFVDLATICFTPTIFQPPISMNVSCTVDHPSYTLGDFVSPHHYVFTEASFWRSTAIPDVEVPPTPPLAEVEVSSRVLKESV